FHLITEVGVDLRTVNRFVATGRPTGALLQTSGVIAIADEDFAVGPLLLEMTFEAEVRVALDQHLLVDRAVRRMAGHAAFADRFMFKHKRAALRGVTLEARSVRAQHGDAAAPYFLRHARSAAFHGVTLVGVMAI